MNDAENIENEEQLDQILQKEEIVIEEEPPVKKEKKSKKKNVKTFNQLDERFQLNEQHDDNHIFEEEKEMIKTLREKLPQWAHLNLTDKFLLTFLFARRHDIKQTASLIDKFLTRRKEMGFEKELPSFDGVVKPFLNGGQSFHLKGAHDKHDRILFYYWIGRDNPRARDLETALGWLFFEVNYIISTESLKNIRYANVNRFLSRRNGEIVIIDLEGFGLRNIDLSSKGREFTNAVSGLTPKRVRGIYLVNCNVVLRTALKAAKLILPRKMTKRINVVHDKEELKEIIDESYLHKMYGGTMDIDDVAEYYYQQIRDNESLWKSHNMQS